MLKMFKRGHYGLSCLVKENQDGARAYREAAELVSDPEVKDTFLRHADMRARFASDLSAEIRKLGQEPPSGGSLAGRALIALKMGWLKLTGADTGRLVSAAESAEDCAMKAYEDALKNDQISGEVRELVKSQRAGIRDMHNAMRLLELRFAGDKAVPERQ